jgi:hypothetical protein
MASGRVDLPFPAPVFWWHRGEPSASKEGSGVAYYGGWAATVDDMQTRAPSIPSKFQQETFESPSGGTYLVYATRVLAIAPIARRFQWVVDQERPGDKGKGHAHILAMCGLVAQDKVSYEAWSPVILSAKGTSAMALDDAMRKWDSATVALRAQLAEASQRLPAYFFWCTVGTFGNERITKTVGEGRNTNYITPAQAYIPDGLTAAKLSKWFVGEQVAQQMLQYRNDAQEWLDAWNKGGDKTKVVVGGQQYDGNGGYGDVPMPPEPDVPF